MLETALPKTELAAVASLSGAGGGWGAGRGAVGHCLEKEFRKEVTYLLKVKKPRPGVGKW